jgi:SAM-dependent methyltransferase
MERTDPNRGVEGVFRGQANHTWQIFLISVLGLFLELMLIRWVGTEVRIFAYLQNTVLVVCFLGLGLGCLTCRREADLRAMLAGLGLLALLLALPPTHAVLARISQLLTVLDDFMIWSKGASTSPFETVASVALGLGLTFSLMIVLWYVFLPVGRLMGRLMSDHPRPILAYSVKVAGGLIGIWLFVGLAALQLPPPAWFLVVAALVALLALTGGEYGTTSRRLADVALALSLALVVWVAGRDHGAMETRWSPYQKLVLGPSHAGPEAHSNIGQYLISVNNVGYQAILDLSPEHVAADPTTFPPEMAGYSQYDIPYRLHPEHRSALIVGAGSGNDVAGALRQGVERVTAVEIDPAIIDMGRRYHPERPYQSPRVRLVNDDARAYFASAQDRFDVISFGLLDSHTTSAMTNARLDHFVYTRESLRRARSLLAPGGIMVLSFESQKPYITDRMAAALHEVFGEWPLAFKVPQTAYGWGGVMLIAGDLARVRDQVQGDARLSALVERWQTEGPVRLTGTTRVATDDWPYIYLESPRIPVLFYLLAGLMVLLLAHAAHKLKLKAPAEGRWRESAHFFFMGAAFLLLEVQNISKAAVVLGSTWMVNAVIISSILAMVLLANLVAGRWPAMKVEIAYAGTLIACGALYVFDMASLGALPGVARTVLVGAWAAAPMFFSGLVFVRSYATSERKDEALGANLLGSLVGGLLQSVTFLVGLKALLLIVAACYVAAYLTRPRGAVTGEKAASPTPQGASAGRRAASSPHWAQAEGPATGLARPS